MALTKFNPRVGKKPAKGEDLPKILYVEDEDANWEITEFSLRNKYNLTRAKTAGQAFKELRNDKFDLILMDIQLSGSDLSGIEVTKVLKGNSDNVPAEARKLVPLDTPIIFVTAYTARYNKQELLDAGGNDLVAKPVDFTKLSLAITRLLLQGVR